MARNVLSSAGLIELRRRKLAGRRFSHGGDDAAATPGFTGYRITTAGTVTVSTMATRVVPSGFTLTGLRFTLATASSSGSVTIDVRRNGTTILTQTQTLLATETDSDTGQGAPYILNADTIDFTGHTVTVVVSAAGTGAADLTVDLLGTLGAALAITANIPADVIAEASQAITGTYTGTPASNGIELGIFEGESALVAYGAATLDAGAASRTVTFPVATTGATVRARYRDSQTNAGGEIRAISGAFNIVVGEGPPPPPPFDPMDLDAKLVEWIDFTNTATRTITDGNVEQVVGRKSVLTFTQATAGLRPAAVASGYGTGVTAATFDGTDDGLPANAAGAIIGFHDSSDTRTMWIAGRFLGTGGGGLGRLYGRENGSAALVRSILSAHTSVPGQIRLNRNASPNGSLDFPVVSSSPGADEGWFIIAYRQDGASGSRLAGSRVNGGTGTQFGDNLGGTLVADTGGIVRLGNSAAGDRAGHVAVTDVLYTEALTAGEQSDLVAFLEARLGRTGLWV